MTFCDNLLKSFSENLKQLSKINDFLLFLRFHENHWILHCFHRRYEFCRLHLQGYFLPAEFISVMKTVQNPMVFMKAQK